MLREIEELRASRARLAAAGDADRRAIERALHEGVQQDLVGLAANLEIVSGSLERDPAAAKELLDELQRETRRALTEVRELAARVFPPLLAVDGLMPELRSAAGRAGVPATIAVDADGPVPPELSGAIYFCALDVFERAPGTPVEIRVRREEGSLAFEIVADGDLGTQHRAPHDRIAAMGGVVSIRSSSGRTTVAGSLPLSR